MELLLATEESMSVQLQTTTWLQILAGIASLIGTAAYVGRKLGGMEVKIDSHFKTIESIGVRMEKDFTEQEGMIRGQERMIQAHEVRLGAVDVSIGHLEQQLSGASTKGPRRALQG